ncbi:MAG: pseudouridine synthase [Opitutales bacterium]
MIKAENHNRESSMDGGETIRIHKLLAMRGICSRRKAEELVELGKVTVNGAPARTGQKVDPANDQVKVNGKLLPTTPPTALCLVMNKPRGFVCTNEDPREPRTVFDLLPKRYRKARLFCAGRLDKETEGLIVLTNDGDLAHRLAHPSSSTQKVYQVDLNKPFDSQHLGLLRRGKVVEGERLWLDKVILIGKKDARPSSRLEIRLGHGRKREIKRLLAAFGYFVERLRRTRVGALSLRKIPKGSFRKLSEREINLLFAEKPPSSKA